LDPTDVEIADLDNANGNDLLVVNSGSDTVGVLYNDGVLLGFGAMFTIVVGDNPLDVEPEDVDHDKLATIDIVVTNQGDGTVSYVKNDGTRAFAAPIDLPVDDFPTKLKVIDLDGNSYPDFVTTNPQSGTMSFIMNGGVSFSPSIQLPNGTNPDSMAIADFDDDGDPDIAVATTDSFGDKVVRVYRNDTQPGGVLTLVQSGEFANGDNPLLVTPCDINNDEVDDSLVVGLTGIQGTPRSIDGGEVVHQSVSTCDSTGGDVSNRVPRVPQNALFLYFNEMVCEGDTSGDGVVNVTDLLMLIVAWGPCPETCPEEINGDGVVDNLDLFSILDSWGEVCQ